MTAFIENYLRDGEGQDVAAQIRYFAYPLEYFDHGNVSEPFVARDCRNYVNRWPERKYMLTEPPKIYATGREGEINVEFTIAFMVRNRSHSASGRTRNYWTLRTEGDEFKIIAIREQRIRE